MSQKIQVHGILPGPIGTMSYNYIQGIKQKLLLFDTIGVPHVNYMLNLLLKNDPEAFKEVHEMAGRGLIFELHESSSTGGFSQSTGQPHPPTFAIPTEFLKENMDLMEEHQQLLKLTQDKNISPELASEIEARSAAILWNGRTHNLKIHDFIPIISMSFLPQFNKPKIDVYNVTLNNVPIPHPDTPIHHIVEFKQDKKNEGRLLKLRAFLNKLGQLGYSKKEMQQEFDFLMHEYHQSMNDHGIIAIKAILKVCIGATGFIIDNDILKYLSYGLTIAMDKLNPANSELTTPGNEISYLYKAHQSFAPYEFNP